ncbi:MAG TPA: tetratricopeptide repeat protein [Longimicrobiales bacterium]|nr:tetratricopeptide repeat protein [Longimicrobiales bacterium]
MVGAFFVALLAFVLYIPGFGNGFVYDAEVLVQHDARVHNLAHPVQLLTSKYWAFDEERLALYRPVVTLSFAIDWVIHRGRAAGFHQTNALAHALVSVLVFLLLTGLAATPAALAGAALFAAHPAHTEAVATIVGRGDIFAAGFSFAALLAWRRLPPRGAAALVTVPALFLLALGSKESAYMLPALLVLFDAAGGRLRRDRVRAWLHERAWLLLALALVAVAYTLVRLAVLGVFAPQSLNPVLVGDPSAATRIRSALQVWPEILRLLTFPRVLLADYGPRILLPAGSWTPRALAGLALLAAASGGGAVAFMRGRRRLGLALLWTPVAMFTVSNLVIPIGVLLAERTLYIAVFAVSVGAAAAIDMLAARFKHGQRAALAGCVVITALFAARTVSRLPAWHSTDEVFRTLARDRPDSYRGQWHHARMATRDGDMTSAMSYYQATIDLWPHAYPVYLEAGMIAAEEGQHVAARSFAEQALDEFPDDAVFLRRLAVASLILNDTAAARDALQRGLKVEPDDPLFLRMRDAIGAPDLYREPR